MSYNVATLLLGSSVPDQKKYLNKCIKMIINDLGPIKKLGVPRETVPLDFTSPNMVLNQIMTIQTLHSPKSLLNEIKNIERRVGRRARIRRKNELYTDREIDIDILFFNTIRFKCSTLLLPHHQVKTRPFVEQMLVDLTEI